MSSEKSDVYTRVTDKIIADLEQGVRTSDLARTNPQGFTVLSTTEMGAKVRETVKTMLVNA